MKKGILIGAGTLLAAGGALSVLAARFEEKIKPNTYVGLVPVGNLTRDEAKKKLRIWWENERVRELKVSVENASKQSVSTIGKLGMTLDDANSIDALPLDTFWDSTLGTIGVGDNAKRSFEPVFRPTSENTAWLDEFVRESIGNLRPAKVFYANGTVTRQYEVTGYSVDRDRLPSAIVEAFKGDGSLTIPIVESPKKIADAELDAIKDVMSEFSTTFPAGQRLRNTNLNLASAKIDGLILMPGEIFSFNERVGKRTIEAGYKEAPVIQNGRHDTGIGGGICQVSGTLYNAVAYANLKVLLRSNHSLPSAYLSLGRDCTVSWPGLDFKFQNNFEHPIAISRTYATGKLTFRILGTRVSGQVVKLETSGRRSWGRGIAYEHDPSLPFGKQKIVEKGSSGHAVNVYRIVLKDGKEVSRELFNSSRYAGSPRIIAINKTAKKPLAPAVPPPVDGDAPPAGLEPEPPTP